MQSKKAILARSSYLDVKSDISLSSASLNAGKLDKPGYVNTFFFFFFSSVCVLQRGFISPKRAEYGFLKAGLDLPAKHMLNP